MKKRIKVISIIGIVIIIVAYSVYAYLQPMEIETKILAIEDSEISFIESGVVINSGEKSIYPLVPGQVESILVMEGDRVKEGDVLAQLDDSAIEFQVAQLESTVNGLEAQLANAEIEHQMNEASLKANRTNLIGQLQALRAQTGSEDQRALEKLLVEQAKELYDQGLEDLANNKELLELGMISKSDYQSIEVLVNSYEANYNQSLIGSDAGADYYQGMRTSLNAQINNIDKTLEMDTLSGTKAYYQASIDGAKASLKSLELQASYYSITAPIDGLVNAINIDNTNMVTGMEVAFVVQGEGVSHIEAKVTTRDIEVIAKGDRVKLILDRRTGDIEINGTITYIANSASIELSPLGIEERKVMVYIEPEMTDVLGSGYDVDVEFLVFSEGNQIVVPNSALYKTDRADTVMVIRSGKATEVPVTLGYELTGETIVEEGLTEGDQLIIDLDAKGLSVGKKVVSSNE